MQAASLPFRVVLNKANSFILFPSCLPSLQFPFSDLSYRRASLVEFAVRTTIPVLRFPPRTSPYVPPFHRTLILRFLLSSSSVLHAGRLSRADVKNSGDGAPAPVFFPAFSLLSRVRNSETTRDWWIVPIRRIATFFPT